MKIPPAMIAFCLCFTSIAAEPAAHGEEQWVQFPDPRFTVSGLPWFSDNAPELWRLPQSSKGILPTAVWQRAVAPDGGRIRFVSNTSHLRLKVRIPDRGKKPCFVDAYTNGVLAGSARLTATNELDVLLFEGADSQSKDVTIYLPNNHQSQVLSIGIEKRAAIEKPRSFALDRPIVCYGSSVLQGTGSAHPSKTYPAVLARKLNLDFVNLGFGGAGKAEREVVDLVKNVDACCYIFDLGKSYGDQTGEPYTRMLATVRAAHPTTPIFCITPIYSTKEAVEPDYFKKSENLRALMRSSVAERQKAGDKFLFVIEGLQLFGEADKDLFQDPLHPNDDGNERIAERLAPFISKVVLKTEQ